MKLQTGIATLSLAVPVALGAVIETRAQKPRTLGESKAG